MQDVLEIRLIQGVHILSSHIISVPHIEIFETMQLGQVHNQGLEHLVDLEQQIIIAQRTLDLIKDNMYCCTSLSWLCYTQYFSLKCGVAEDGRRTFLFSTVPNYEFSIVCDHETAHVSPCRSTTLSHRSSDDERISWRDLKGGALQHIME